MEIYKYKTIDNQMMEMQLFKPNNWKKEDKRICIIFYFGGGFIKRNIRHFQRQAEYFQGLGAISILCDYRLASEGSGIETCRQDAEAALKEVYDNSESLGIDQRKIVVCGGSAGGALACMCSMSTKIPCAQVLFNPVLFMCDEKVELITSDEITSTKKSESFNQTLNITIQNASNEFSAYHLLDHYTIPSTLILQGTYDPITYRGVVLFHQKAIENKEDCRTIYYEGESHGFFNYEKIENKFCYYDTLNQMEKFLKYLNLI